MTEERKYCEMGRPHQRHHKRISEKKNLSQRSENVMRRTDVLELLSKGTGSESEQRGDKTGHCFVEIKIC